MASSLGDTESGRSALSLLSALLVVDLKEGSDAFHYLLKLSCGIAGVMAFGVQPMTADTSTKLTGCLVRGSGDGAGYLLVNVAAEPTVANSSQVLPTAIGTSGTYANVFYWLDNDGDLQAHVGHQVEIEGETKGDVKDGEMKIDQQGSMDGDRNPLR